MSEAVTASTGLERCCASKTAQAALYHLRASGVESLQQRETRVRACFEAGALATGCAHEATRVSSAHTDLVPDPRFAAAYRVAVTGLAAATGGAQHERLITQRERLVGRVSWRPVASVTAAGGAV